MQVHVNHQKVLPCVKRRFAHRRWRARWCPEASLGSSRRSPLLCWASTGRTWSSWIERKESTLLHLTQTRFSWIQNYLLACIYSGIFMQISSVLNWNRLRAEELPCYWTKPRFGSNNHLIAISNADNIVHVREQKHEEPLSNDKRIKKNKANKSKLGRVCWPCSFSFWFHILLVLWAKNFLTLDHLNFVITMLNLGYLLLVKFLSSLFKLDRPCFSKAEADSQPYIYVQSVGKG